MLAEALNTTLYPEWLDYIDSTDTKQAFLFIVGMGACSRAYKCHPQRKGSVRDFRFVDRCDEQVFALIVNRNSLLFYFRRSAVRSDQYDFETIKLTFPDCKKNVRGEWTVRISNLQDASKLLPLLKLS